MMFVKIILAVCMLVGSVVATKAGSVSSVNCVQSTFLWFVNVRLLCCSIQSCRMLIMVMMARWSDDSAC